MRRCAVVLVLMQWGCPSGPVVKVSGGSIQGMTNDAGVNVFLGVPYAAAPVGNLRFRPPAPATWSGTLPATTYGHECLQPGPDYSAECGTSPPDGGLAGSEDCLTLNIWTPADAAAALPVMVFIHGGGNDSESSDSPKYDGTYLASKGPVVVVTIEYRLGALGFLAHRAFAEEAGGVTGDYGLMDQIFALQWVQDNIAQFHGDPMHVLVFGQSAGARDSCLLVASPLAKGLFSSALVMSGGCKAQTLDAGEAEADSFAALAGCPGDGGTAECLRDAGEEALIYAQQCVHFPKDIAFPEEGDLPPDQGWKYPIIQGVPGSVLPDTPLHLLASDSHNDVPVVMSNCRDEFANLSMFDGIGGASVVNQSTLEHQVECLYGTAYGQSVLATYLGDDEIPDEAAASVFVRIASDSGYICPTRQALRVLLTQKSPVYRVLFDWATDSPYVPHASDLPFAFHETEPTDSCSQALSDAMVRLWTHFAGSGNFDAALDLPPDGCGVANAMVPPLYTASDPYLILSEPLAIGEGLDSAPCDFWDAVPDAGVFTGNAYPSDCHY